MDIVGPLPKTARGHRYILVICDYTTWHTEAMPLKKFTVPAVAEQLMELLSTHGVPKDILTDQGTNFMSQLLQELYKMLGVKPVRTTPYHPQTNGLVERFNQTLKQMLRKMIGEEGQDWDKLVPYILFAYREVSQSSMGFSPFEMVNGRDVRGPLDMLKEGWTGAKPGGDDIITYVIRIHECLETAKETVLENLRQAQQKQKTWYDKRSRETQFEVGDKVLVLLPTRTEKLLAKWKGPYNVIRKVGKVNYELEIMDERKGRKLFHVNMLNKWNEPEEMFVNQISDKRRRFPATRKSNRIYRMLCTRSN